MFQQWLTVYINTKIKLERAHSADVLVEKMLKNTSPQCHEFEQARSCGVNVLSYGQAIPERVAALFLVSLPLKGDLLVKRQSLRMCVCHEEYKGHCHVIQREQILCVKVFSPLL